MQKFRLTVPITLSADVRQSVPGSLAEALACIRDAAEVYPAGGVSYAIPTVEHRITELRATPAKMKR